MVVKQKRGKLVIEITEDEGQKYTLKRTDGVGKLLDNIDNMFKRGKVLRAVKGVKMFFVPETTFGPLVSDQVPSIESALPVEPLSDTKPFAGSGMGSTSADEPEVTPSDEEIEAGIDAAIEDN